LKFVRDTAGSGLLIRSCEPGRIWVGGQYHATPLIVSRLQVRGWTGAAIETLDLEQLQPALVQQPEILLLGCGLVRIQPPAVLIAGLAELGTGLEIMDGGAACRTYNILACEGRNVVAALLA